MLPFYIALTIPLFYPLLCFTLLSFVQTRTCSVSLSILRSSTYYVSIFLHHFYQAAVPIKISNLLICSCSLMVRWVIRSILHGVDPSSYFSFQPVLHDWCNKICGMYYPACGMVHIKEPLLLIDKSSLCGGRGFPFSLSEWSLTICLTPYNRR